MLTSNDVKVSKIDGYIRQIIEGGWKDQTIKNKIYSFKKNGKYREYLALKCAYEIYKINRE